MTLNTNPRAFQISMHNMNINRSNKQNYQGHVDRHKKKLHG